MSHSHLLGCNISSVAVLLRNGAVSAKQLAQMSLERIAASSQLNPFITVTQNKCLQQADAADQRLKENRALSLLDGIPVAIKDNFNVKDIRMTCASKMLANYVAPYDATVVKRLTEDSGALCLGKTNMDEFSIGSTCVESFFGPCFSPWKSGLPFSHNERDDAITNTLVSDPYVPGGSSGGSAVAVATGCVFAALGSDTGGSTRYPAALTGVVGFKPTYGVLSRYGLVPLSHSMDTVGIIARTVDDVRIVFNQIRGFDTNDSTSALTVPQIYKNVDLTGIRIGISDDYLGPGISEEVVDLLSETCKKLEEAGARLVKVSLPHTKYASSCYTILNSIEIASNFACYDGTEYGLRIGEEVITGGMKRATLEDVYEANRSEGFGDPVKGRIQAGNYFLLKENYSKYVRPAYQMRRLILHDFMQVLGSHSDARRGLTSDDRSGEEIVDVLLTPITRDTAFRLKDCLTQDSRELAAREDFYTQPSNLSGLPAITFPCCLSPSSHLPLGLQLIASPFHDDRLLALTQSMQHLFNFPSLKYLST